MRVKDLIRNLEGMDPEAEVRLAMQPSWPFEHSIGRVIEVDVESDFGESDWECPVCYDIYMSEEELTHHVEIEHDQPYEPKNTERESTTYVYIAESSQIGYLPFQATQELGWK